MFRRLLVAAALVLGTLLADGAAPLPAGAQDEPTPTTAVVSDQDSGIGDILPRPNSGEAPDSANDRGGWQQYMVFGLILVGLAAIVLLVRRESRHALAGRDTTPGTSTEG